MLRISINIKRILHTIFIDLFVEDSDQTKSIS